MIENNNYSVYTPLHDRQRNTCLADKLAGFSNEVYFSTDHDYNMFSAHCGEAVSAAHEGKPAFLIANTYRYLEHCGPSCDDQLGYRTSDYIDHWKSLDILDLFTNHLLEYYDESVLVSARKHIVSKCRLAYEKSLARLHYIAYKQE